MALAIYTEKISPLLDQACAALKLDKLNENQFLSDLSQKTQVKPSHMVLLASTVFLTLSLLNVGASLICNLIGFIYPAYASFKALETVGGEDDKQWLTYWIVYSLFTLADPAISTVLSFVPFFYFIKLVFYVYLFHPHFLGASVIFEKFIRPYLKKYESKIDNEFNKLKNKVNENLYRNE